MRTKIVKRHWCDFCNKAGLQAHAMAKHERHCTMNPTRSCRTCRLIDGGNGPDADGLRALVAILPPGPVPGWGDELEAFLVKVDATIPQLRTAAGDCPACMLAALRQAGIPVPAVQSFDFKKEMAEVLAAKAREDDDNRGYTRGWP